MRFPTAGSDSEDEEPETDVGSYCEEAVDDFDEVPSSSSFRLQSARVQSARVDTLAATYSSARMDRATTLTRHGSVLAQILVRERSTGPGGDALAATTGLATVSAADAAASFSPRRASLAAGAAAAAGERRRRARAAAATTTTTTPGQRAEVQESLERFDLQRELHSATHRLAKLDATRREVQRTVATLRMRLADPSSATAQRDWAPPASPDDPRYSVLKEGIVRFNRSAKHGVRYLLNEGYVSDPIAVAMFLRRTSGLNRAQIGEYIAGPSPFASQAADAFFASHNWMTAGSSSHSHDVRGRTRSGSGSGRGSGRVRGGGSSTPSILPLDEALRSFLHGWTLPGEAGPIDRLMQRFATAYFEEASGDTRYGGVFSHVDSVYVTAFALIMLQTDLHNPNIPRSRRMKLSEFIRTLAGINDGENLDERMLTAFYRRVKASAFEVPPPPSLALRIYPSQEGWLQKVGHVNERTTQNRYFILRDSSLAYFNKQEGATPRGIVHLAGCTAALSPDKRTMEIRHGSGSQLMIAKGIELRDHLRLRFDSAESGVAWLGALKAEMHYSEE